VKLEPAAGVAAGSREVPGRNGLWRGSPLVPEKYRGEMTCDKGQYDDDDDDDEGEVVQQ
jgi:hypothetical protein